MPGSRARSWIDYRKYCINLPPGGEGLFIPSASDGEAGEGVIETGLDYHKIGKGQ